jgi:peroxiredoxin
MKTRWFLAAVGAGLFVALLTWLPIRPSTDPMADGGASVPGPVSSQSGSCGPNAKPAGLAFIIKDMDGKDVNLAAFKGKVLLLNFWATWCGPCLQEIPAFVDLQARYRDQGLVIIGISVDDPIEKLKPFAQEFRMNYPVLAGADRSDVQEAYGPLFGVPVSVLISRDGLMCKRFVGGTSKQQFEREIKALL